MYWVSWHLYVPQKGLGEICMKIEGHYSCSMIKSLERYVHKNSTLCEYTMLYHVENARILLWENEIYSIMVTLLWI